MEFLPIDFTQFNETDVREEILAPLLRELGYRSGTANNVIREQYIRYPYRYIGRKKSNQDPPLAGKADYICDIDRKLRWVLEAKSPGVDIGPDEIEQAYSYANHPEIRAIYFCICNGLKFRIYQTNLGPEVEAIFSTTYDKLSDEYQTIANILSPESLKRDWGAHTIVIGKPIGPGLRSICRVTNGYFEYTYNSFKNHSLNGLIVSITGGTIQRKDNGMLEFYLLARPPFSALQKLSEKLGFNKWVLVCKDTVLSTDPNNPTIAEDDREYIFPKGESMYDFTTGNNIILPFNLTTKVYTNAVGTLNGQDVSGHFESKFDYQEFNQHMILRGNFALHLA